MRNLTSLIFAATLAFAASGALAAGPEVSSAWIRLLPAGVPAAGYFELVNKGKDPVTLIGAESPKFGHIMLHETVNHAGMSTMEAVRSVIVAPGTTLTFAPGGYHLMLMQGAPGLKAGQKVPITLKFSGGQSLTVDFELRGATAQ